MNFTGSGTIIDLSLTLAGSLPCTWPGHMLFAHNSWVRFTEQEPGAKDIQKISPYQTNFIIIDEHCGTHFDASTHFIPPEDSGLPFAGPLGSNSGEKVCLDDLIGQAIVIDVRFLNRLDVQPGISPAITVEHVASWEAEHGAIQAREIVLFYTGWDRYYQAGNEGRQYVQGPVLFRDTPGWPAPGPETVIYLHEKGVKTIGTDATSLGSSHNGAPMHQEGLKRGLIYIEGLTNLDQLPPRGAQFVFLPLKVAGATGCPGRAIAIISQGEK